MKHKSHFPVSACMFFGPLSPSTSVEFSSLHADRGSVFPGCAAHPAPGNVISVEKGPGGMFLWFDTTFVWDIKIKCVRVKGSEVMLLSHFDLPVTEMESH